MDSIDALEGIDAVRWQAGLHIVGTSLWCDALRPRGACFVSSITPLLGDRRRCKQLVVSGEVGAAIEKLALVAPHALLTVRPYRPFSLGRARVEVLETGERGAAAICVEVDRRRVLYVDTLPESGVTLRDVDVLVVGRSLVEDEVNLIDQLVNLIDQRLAHGEGTCDLVLRDLAWLPHLARWPVRLSPQLAAMAELLCPSLVNDPTGRVQVALRGHKSALVLDRLPSQVSRLPRLVEALGANTIYTTCPVPAITGVRTRVVARPTQLGLWREGRDGFA